MELLQLTYFCDAAVTQNFSKTAQKYNVPPSNISQSIKRLERELSAPLFDRRAIGSSSMPGDGPFLIRYNRPSPCWTARRPRPPARRSSISCDW